MTVGSTILTLSSKIIGNSFIVFIGDYYDYEDYVIWSLIIVLLLLSGLVLLGDVGILSIWETLLLLGETEALFWGDNNSSLFDSKF